MASENDPPVSPAEARLARAQAVAHVGSWELDVVRGTMWASDEAFRIYGFPRTPDNVVPLEVAQKIPLAAHRPRLDRALADLLADDTPYDLGFAIERPDDGARRRVRSRAEVQRDGEGRPLMVVGTVQDVTAEWQTRRELRDALARSEAALEALSASEERTRMVFEHAADAILLGAPDGSVTGLNERVEELSGYTRAELLGRRIDVLFSGAERERVPLRYDLVDRGEVVVRERDLTRKDGRIVPVEMRSARLPDGTYQAILRDLTERRRLEEQLTLRQRMDSLGTLTSGIAHDFNNILAAILGYAGVLDLDADALTPDQRESVGNILQAAGRATDLIRRLQAINHAEPATDSVFELGPVAADAFEVLGETTDPLITKELALSASPTYLAGSASDLYNALLNLGINAVQAIEERGARAGDRVRLEERPYAAGPSDPLGLAPGDYVHLAFSDTGPGMDEDVRRHAFDPLFTTKAHGARRGQGLGLTMVYGTVVDRQGGHIDIASRPGAGATFHLYLPRAQREATPPPALDVTPLAPGRETILLVEDEEPIRRLMMRILGGLGYEVLAAEDGRSGIATFVEVADRVALVVLDCAMPRMSGAEVYRELQRLRPGTRVLVSSGNLLEHADEFPGARGTIAKPFHPSELAAAVRAALDAV